MKRSLRSWLWRVPLEREVDEELAFHVEMRVRDLVAEGMSEVEARRVAMSRLGNVSRIRKACVTLGRKREREMRIGRWMREFRQDLRFTVRQLAGAPTFTLVAVVTLALGIGANAAIFALVDATLLRPLPFPEPDRLVKIWERTDASPRETVAPFNMFDWRDRSETVARMAGHVPDVGGMVMAGADGATETVPRQWVTAGIFDVLGVTPVAGRTFNEDDERQRRSAVVFTESFWSARFGRDPAVVGSDVRLDGEPYTVVGVVPDEARVIGDASLWALITFPADPRLRTARVFEVVGRLEPGATVKMAGAELARIADDLARELPGTNSGRGVTVEPYRAAVVGSDLRLTSLLFLGVVGFVLLICCANVANLLLARTSVRRRELTLRSALGAGRARIVRQLLSESLLLATLGGVLGLMTGAAILAAAPSIVPAGLLPSTVELSFDFRVVGFCAVAVAAVAVLFGLAPAWQATTLSPARGIGSGDRTTPGAGGRLRALLVAGEVATAVLLLFGAGLLLRTLIAVETTERGYRGDNVLTMLVDPLGSEYPTPEALLGFLDAVEREALAAPGVRSVGWTSTLPLGNSVVGGVTFEIVGATPLPPAERPVAEYQIASPGYFETIEVPLVEGRMFTAFDTYDATRVALVNETFVRRHLQGRSPIGVQLALSNPNAPLDAEPVVREVVGVVGDVRRRPDQADTAPQVYAAMSQIPLGDVYFVARPESRPADAITGAIRAAIATVDRAQLVSVRDIETLDAVAGTATGRYRFRATLVGTFAGLALLLAMVGVFGILAYSVQQRSADFAVRRALGASTRDVVRLVVSGAARVVIAGAVIGLVLAAGLGRVLTAVLFGVEPLDAPTFAAVVTLLALAAAASVAAPAWRAVRIDPATALRDQ